MENGPVAHPRRPAGRRLGRSGKRRGWGVRGWLWGLGALVVAFVVGYLLTAAIFFPASDRPPVVAVPDLRDMDTDAARSVLGPAGLILEMADTLPNAEVAEGMILSQTPLPGQEVAPGSGVRVILSGGTERRAVPVVTAMTLDQARRLLEASGFEVSVEEVEDPRAKGRVVGVEPRPGTELQVPAPVRLRVSTGPPLVEVPDLYGMSEDEVRAELQAAGLELGDIDYRYAGLGAEELVIGQEPLPGESVEQGSEVTVRMSTDRLRRRMRR